jgi:hypothetical protein
MARKCGRIAPADEPEADVLIKHQIVIESIKLNIEATGQGVTEMFELGGSGKANAYPGTIVGPLSFPGYAGISLQSSPARVSGVNMGKTGGRLTFSLWVSEREFDFLKRLLLQVGPRFPTEMGLVVAAFTKAPFPDGRPRDQMAERHAFYLSADWRPRRGRKA